MISIKKSAAIRPTFRSSKREKRKNIHGLRILWWFGCHQCIISERKLPFLFVKYIPVGKT